MNTIAEILPYIQITLSILLIAGVLLQQSSSGLGGAFGENNNFGTGYHTRRGFEKVLFNGTIVIGILFALSAFAALIIR
jgi:protein translocase SecG subunit